MSIILSHGGETHFSSSSPSNEIWIGTKEGVVLLKRDSVGSEWKVAHRALTDKHIHAIILEPVSGTMFAGATKDSIYASDDGGYTWERRDNGITQTDIYSLNSVEREGGVRVFAGTEPAHLFYTDDLGHNWKEMTSLRSVDTSDWMFPAPPNVAHTKHINFHPEDPNTLFIGIEVGGLQKSTDGGKTFTRIYGMDSDVHRTVINPQDPDKIYITGGDGTWLTHDGGDNWEHLTTVDHEIGGYPDFLLLHPKNPEQVFVASAQHGPGSWGENKYAGTRVSKSADGGRTWTQLRGGLPDRLQTAVEAMCLEDWGDGFSIFAATATGEVWGSDDGGEHWSEIVTGLAPISKGPHYKMLTTV